MMTVPDIPRLYTAIDEWAGCLIYILIVRKRFTGVRLGILSALALIILGGLQLINGMLPLFLWIPGMIPILFILG
jgi:hypothetical protein